MYGEPALAVPLHDLRFSVVLNTVASPWGTPDSGAEPEISTLDSGRREEFALDDFADTAVFPVFPPDPPRSDELVGPSSEDGFEPFVNPEHRPGGVPMLAEDHTLDFSGPPPLSVDVGEDAPDGAETDVARALAATAGALGLPVPLPLRVAVRSGGLRSGMGTSAAMGVALSRALLLFYGQQPSLAAVLRGAAAVEQLFHGSPSGVDHTVAAAERPVWFVKGKPLRQLGKLPALDLVILPRLSQHRTADVVTGVRARLADDPGLARSIAALGRWTREGRVGWSQGNLRLLGDAMNAQQTELDRLGVVQDSDREGVARAREAGALAAKITGAGCGGTLFALVTESSRDAVLEAWGPTALQARVGSRN